jgi:RNA polymerase sigma factor (sigma-70 family)
MGSVFEPPSRQGLDAVVAAAQADEIDNTPAMNEVVRRFDRLALSIPWSLGAPAHLHDDLANAARLGLVRAVRRHDGRPGFAAFAEIYMRGAAMREYRRWMLPEVADTDAIERLEHHDDGLDHPGASERRLAPWGDGAVAAVIAGLKPQQREIAWLRYGLDLPIKSIAATMGTSGPAVSQRLATIHRLTAAALA